jgi:hypothetical protein
MLPARSLLLKINHSAIRVLRSLLLRFIGHDECGMPIYSELWNVRPNPSSRPGGPVAKLSTMSPVYTKRQPSPEGLRAGERHEQK